MVKKDRILLIIMTVGLSLMLIMRDIWGIGINKYLYLAFVVSCMVLADYKTLVNMICFILPLVCGLPGTYIMPLAVLLLIFKRGRVQLVTIFFVVCLSMLEIVASFWYPTVDIPNIVQYISFMAVVILLIHNSADIDYEQGVRMYLYGVLLLCGVIIVVTLQTAPYNWLDQFARGAFRFGNTYMEDGGMQLNLNANSLAYYSITGITCGIFMAERRKGAARIFYIAVAVFTALAGFFTLSRSWIVVLVLCMLLYAFSKMRRAKQFFALVGVLAVLAVVITIWLQNNPRLLNGFVSRFASDDVESGNNRSDLFYTYMEYYFSDPRYILFGSGVTQYRQVLQTGRGAIHNGIQQILVCTGFVGFVLYLFALAGPLLTGRKRTNGSFAAWLPLISIVGFIQSIQFLNPMMLMLPYAIGVFSLRAAAQTPADNSVKIRK